MSRLWRIITQYQFPLYFFASLLSVPEVRSEEICLGTRFKSIESAQSEVDNWIQYARDNIANCTHVVGNLQLIDIYLVESDAEIFSSYFREIREITGYLLIYNVYVEQLSFKSLRMIRGQTLCRFNTVDPEYGLIVAYTNYSPELVNLTLLTFPALREIQNGSVLITNIRLHCYLKTVDWREIMSGKNAQLQLSEKGAVKGESKSGCEGCDPSCASCWGNGPMDCQKFSRRYCSAKCESEGLRCFGNGTEECCDESCAGGCTGPGRNMCVSCTHVFYNGECVRDCPSGGYKLGSSCVESCGDFVVDEEERACLAECGSDKREINGKCMGVVLPERKCRSPSDIWGYVHSGNIESFRGCSVIDGSLYISDDVLSEHSFPHNLTYSEKHGPLNLSDLETFSSLTEVTGDVVIIDVADKVFKNLSCFRNLKKVGGWRWRNYTVRNRLVITDTSLEMVDLRKLRSVGSVDISHNEDLCYIGRVNWNGISDHVFVDQNLEDWKCKRRGFVCSKECLENQGCWGEKETDCQGCREYRNGRICVDKCPWGFRGNSERYCVLDVGVLLLVVVVVGILLVAILVVVTRRKLQKFGGDGEEQLEPNVLKRYDGEKCNLSRFRAIGEDAICRGEVLGSGNFGTVYAGVWKADENYSIDVAIKVVSNTGGREFMDEAFLMGSLDHPHIHGLLGACMGFEIMLVMELMELGNLKEYLTRKKGYFGPQEMITWGSQIAQGMEYLESKQVVHRDLAARNVLLDTPLHVKSSDFGMAKLLSTGAEVLTDKAEMLPVRWLAIECLQSGTYSHKSDVWAFGVTMWEILSYGANPYESQNVAVGGLKAFLVKGERLLQPEKCSIELYKNLTSTWMAEPDERPGFGELEVQFVGMLEDPGRYVISMSGDEGMGHAEKERENLRRLAAKKKKTEAEVAAEGVSMSGEESMKLQGGYYCCNSESGKDNVNV